MNLTLLRRWLPGRGTLLFYSTLLAAVAAIFSAIAAFRQEKATFYSNLYANQVAATADLNRTSSELNSVANAFVLSAWDYVINQKGTFEETEELYGKIEPAYVAARAADMQMCILVGDDYTISQDRLTQARWNSTEIARAIYYKLRDAPNHRIPTQEFEQMRLRFIESGMTGGETLMIVACAHDHLKRGRPIPAGAFRRCEARARAARNEGVPRSEQDKAPDTVEGWAC